VRRTMITAIVLLGCGGDDPANGPNDAGPAKQDADTCQEAIDAARQRIAQLHAGLSRSCAADEDCALVSKRSLTRCFSYNDYYALAGDDAQALKDGAKQIDEELCGAFPSRDPGSGSVGVVVPVEPAACETDGETGENEGVVPPASPENARASVPRRFPAGCSVTST
jgi:hypothetical protein